MRALLKTSLDPVALVTLVGITFGASVFGIRIFRHGLRVIKLRRVQKVRCVGTQGAAKQ